MMMRKIIIVKKKENSLFLRYKDDMFTKDAIL